MADLSPLADVGLDLDLVSEEQRTVLESLTENEILMLADITRRLNDAAGDLEGHMDGGGFCW